MRNIILRRIKMSDQTDVEYFIKVQRNMLMQVTDLIYIKDYNTKSKKVDAYKLKVMEDLKAIAKTIKVERK